MGWVGFITVNQVWSEPLEFKKCLCRNDLWWSPCSSSGGRNRGQSAWRRRNCFDYGLYASWWYGWRESRLGEFEVVVKDGTARLKESGSLAGSILELIEAVQNVVKWGLVSLPDALRMASLAPARSVNIDHICGRIAEGRAADFIVVDDAGRLQATYLDGVKRFG